MVNGELTDSYLALTNAEKQIFLAIVSHQLTIHARGAGLYLSGEQQARALLGFSELQHQISHHISDLGLGLESHPDATFLDLLADEASSFGLTAPLKQSLESAKKK